MSVILIDRHPTTDGRVLVELRLNAPKSLNAVNGEMIAQLHQHLDQCEDDPEVVAVILDSTGEKAFCAGGDVVGLRSECLAGDTEAAATAFFEAEYRLDHAIHTYSKPIIGWGGGIVMGGGMGLLCGCSHRVVTETTMMAMPEITIGLYPDVGGSWFLNRAPGRTGVFIGLTGARLNAADACFVGFADRVLHSGQRDELLQRLLQADWTQDEFASVHGVLKTLEAEAGIESQSAVRKHFDLIQQLTDHSSVVEIAAAIVAMDCGEDKWLSRAQQALRHGSPLAAHLIFEQLKKTRHLSLTEVFQDELSLSVQCCLQEEFFEGVRALLVDKDGKPAWRYTRVESVEQEVIDSCFEIPWIEHPLEDL